MPLTTEDQFNLLYKIYNDLSSSEIKRQLMHVKKFSPRFSLSYWKVLGFSSIASTLSFHSFPLLLRENLFQFPIYLTRMWFNFLAPANDEQQMPSEENKSGIRLSWFAIEIFCVYLVRRVIDFYMPCHQINITTHWSKADEREIGIHYLGGLWSKREKLFFFEWNLKVS